MRNYFLAMLLVFILFGILVITPICISLGEDKINEHHQNLIHFKMASGQTIGITEENLAKLGFELIEQEEINGK